MLSLDPSRKSDRFSDCVPTSISYGSRVNRALSDRTWRLLDLWLRSRSSRKSSTRAWSGTAASSVGAQSTSRPPLHICMALRTLGKGNRRRCAACDTHLGYKLCRCHVRRNVQPLGLSVERGCGSDPRPRRFPLLLRVGLRDGANAVHIYTLYLTQDAGIALQHGFQLLLHMRPLMAKVGQEPDRCVALRQNTTLIHAPVLIRSAPALLRLSLYMASKPLRQDTPSMGVRTKKLSYT